MRGEGGRQQNKGAPPHLSHHVARPCQHDTLARDTTHPRATTYAASRARVASFPSAATEAEGIPPGKNGSLVLRCVCVFASQEDTAPRGSSASEPRGAAAATDAATTEAAAAEAAARAAAAERVTIVFYLRIDPREPLSDARHACAFLCYGGLTLESFYVERAEAW